MSKTDDGKKSIKRIKITDTTLRDGHQSLLATRMRIEDMLPVCEMLDNIGFNSLEVWGGATFDSCMRFLNEDPWERLSALKKKLKTPLQMLLRGQNILGYKHYPDDVLTAFIERAVYNGMDIFRIFDALNDIRNMKKSIEVVKREGAHAQATVVYTISPVHNLEYYVKLAKSLQETGADSICIKDMAGILAPQPAHDIVKGIKEEVSLPLQIHCHYTSGMASMSYLRAIDAGIDIIDCAISTMALQTSQPSVETMVASLKDTRYDTGLNLLELAKIAEYFKEVRKKYAQFDVASKSVDTTVMVYQIPGGMMSNFITQLGQQDALDRLPEVLEELPRVREDFGYPPLVTPSSQIVGAQAVTNVLLGRYKLNNTEVKQYMRGYYGQPPAPVNKEAQKAIIGDEEPITCRPADLLEPGMPKAREQAAPYMQKEEDVISVALFNDMAIEFLKSKMSKETNVDYNIADQENRELSLKVYPA